MDLVEDLYLDLEELAEHLHHWGDSGLHGQAPLNSHHGTALSADAMMPKEYRNEESAPTEAPA